METTSQRHPLTKLVRDAVKVKNNLKTLETGELVTTVPCKIQVPIRYAELGLAEIGIDTFTYGIYALIMEDSYYAVSNITAMINIDPYKIIEEKVGGVEYHSFYFEPNTVMIKNLNVVLRNSFIYKILKEFYFQGKIPWYLNYEDLAKIFDTANDYAGSHIANRYEVIEMLTSLITRNHKDRSQYYRNVIKSRDELFTNLPDFIPLTSVFYSATSTVNKLAGNYYDHGIISSLVMPSTKVEHIEALLRA
jgi:hypothetical protein